MSVAIDTVLDDAGLTNRAIREFVQERGRRSPPQDESRSSAPPTTNG